MNKLFIYNIFNYFSSVFYNFLLIQKLNARTGILIDYHSDKILYEFDPDAQIYPASMTKIMTSIIAFDLIKKNKLI